MANCQVWNRTLARGAEDGSGMCGPCFSYGSIYHREFLAALYKPFNVSQLFYWDLECVSLPPNIFDWYEGVVISMLKNGSGWPHLGYLRSQVTISISI